MGRSRGTGRCGAGEAAAGQAAGREGRRAGGGQRRSNGLKILGGRIPEPVTNQVTTTPDNRRRKTTRSDTVIPMARGNSTQPDGMHRVDVDERQGARAGAAAAPAGPAPPGTPGPLLQLRDVPEVVAAQVRAQRGRRPDAAGQRGHRAVPQQAHVIDRIRPGGHPGDQARHLQVRADPALAARPDVLRH